MNDGKAVAVGDRMRQIERAECAHGVGIKRGRRRGDPPVQRLHELAVAEHGHRRRRQGCQPIQCRLHATDESREGFRTRPIDGQRIGCLPERCHPRPALFHRRMRAACRRQRVNLPPPSVPVCVATLPTVRPSVPVLISVNLARPKANSKNPSAYGRPAAAAIRPYATLPIPQALGSGHPSR